MIHQEIASNNQVPESMEELRLLVQSQQKQLESLRVYYVEELQTLKEQLESLEKLEKGYKVEIQIMRERIKELTRRLFGRNSEKNILDDTLAQMSLFEDDVEVEVKELEIDETEETIIVPSHKRKKGGRKPLPVELPRVEIIHDLSAEEKQCPCGCEMSRIGEEYSEKLEMLPPQLWVVREVRYKYACKHCEGVESDEDAVKISPLPPQIVPKSIATPSLLAHVFVSKFADSLPFYRQEKQFSRYGIEVPRSKMCHWAFHVSDKLEKLLEILWLELRSGPYISMDETTVQVLKEPNRRAGNKSYMWVIRGGPPGQKIVLFHYSPSRGREVAKRLIGNFHGYVQTDGYGSYDFLDSSEGIVHVGCWAHVRRKFVEVAKLYPSNNKKSRGGGKAGHAIQTIGKLYRLEDEARKNNLTAQEIYRLRQSEAKPTVEEFKEWLQANVADIPPNSALGSAFIYALHQWPRLINYLESGIVPIDNNLTENAIRPFVVGRKNWLFSDQPKGAHASAIFYSLIETAKGNGLEPYAYFLYLLDRLPFAATEDDLKRLSPTCISHEKVTEFKADYWMKYKGNS